MTTQVCDQRAGQHNTLLGLQRQLCQRLDGLPVTAHGEGLETERRLQFNQMLMAGLIALAVLIPTSYWHLQLRGHHAQQGRRWGFIGAQNDAGKSQVAQLDGKAKPVGWLTMLPNDGQVGIAEGAKPDKLVFALGQCQQALTLGG